VDLPVEYRIKNLPRAHGGLVVNASENGLLIHSVKNMPLGLKLRIAVMFLTEYELTHFDVTAEIIWKDFRLCNDSDGYQYGLKIVQILDEDHRKLKQILGSPLQQGEGLAPSPLPTGASPPE
jgi:hypothetical protein